MIPGYLLLLPTHFLFLFLSSLYLSPTRDAGKKTREKKRQAFFANVPLSSRVAQEKKHLSHRQATAHASFPSVDRVRLWQRDSRGATVDPERHTLVCIHSIPLLLSISRRKASCIWKDSRASDKQGCLTLWPALQQGTHAPASLVRRHISFPRAYE